jgi:putative membrane protein
MFVSSTYELIEWWVSVFSGEAGDSFLGTQGYIWDTQTDMLMALIGGIVAQLFLSKALQKNINRLFNIHKFFKKILRCIKV